VTGETAGERAPIAPSWLRPALFVTALVLLVAVLVPPLATLARRYDSFEALQFSVLAVVVPALAVVGAPWRRLRVTGGPSASAARSARIPGRSGGSFLLRRRRPGYARATCVLAVQLGLIIGARSVPVVDALVRHPWLVLLEAACLLAGGIPLWLEMVESPPVRPTLPRPARIALAAFTMWTIWVSAYLVGMARGSVYRDLHRLPGPGLSFGADQQIAAFVLWWIALACFVPVIFWNLVAWLRAEEDPDEEMRKLVRENKRRAWGTPPSQGGIARSGNGAAG